MHERDDEESIQTKEIKLSNMDFGQISSKKSYARVFVRYLIQAARKIAQEHEWSAEDLIEVLKFSQQGGEIPVNVFDGQLFKKSIEEAIHRAQRYQENFSVMIVDFNSDEFSTTLYDSVLDGLVERLRNSDQIFLLNNQAGIILPYTSGKDLTTLTARIENLFLAALDVKVNLAFDHIAFPTDYSDHKDFMHWVDQKLNQAESL